MERRPFDGLQGPGVRVCSPFYGICAFAIKKRYFFVDSRVFPDRTQDFRDRKRALSIEWRVLSIEYVPFSSKIGLSWNIGLFPMEEKVF